MGLKAVCRVSAVLVAFVACSYQCILLALTHYSDSLLASVAYGLLSVIFGLLSAICIDIIHLNPADSFTWYTLIYHYSWHTILTIWGWRAFNFIKEKSKDITKYQDKVLMDIIKMNGSTDYAKDHGVDKIKSSAEFREKVPLGTYDMCRDYIERVKKGDYKAFTNDKVKVVVYTSGTTGAMKFYPWTETAPLPEGKALIQYNIHRRVGRSLGRGMMLFHTYNATPPPPGIPAIRAMSTVAFGKQPFWLQPKEVYELEEEPSCLYGTAIFALREREIDHLTTVLASMMFSFWVVVGNKWRQMCDNIENGYIDHGILKVDDKTLEIINSHLTPDPERAKELRREFSRGMHKIARRIWPRLYVVDMICTGTLAHPAKLLQENQLYGIPFLSLYVAATEGISCTNMDDELECHIYALSPLKQYYEWIPEKNINDPNPATLETAQLKVGEAYEMVLTTYCGLTRYRSGDVLQCVRKINQLPEFEFSYRHGQLLNLIGEKVTEKTFYESLVITVGELHLKLIDYTCTSSRMMSTNKTYVDKYGDPTYALPYYVLFCEFEQNGKIAQLSEEEKKKFDENLSKKGDGIYGPFRECNGLAQMQVFEMKTGTFQELKALMIKDTQTQQFKMPRLVKDPTFLEFLMNHVETA